MSEPVPPDSVEILLPLRDRIPDYLAIFGWGWLGVLVVGFAFGAFSTVSIVEGISYVALAYGAVLLLSGGAIGGGYTSLGRGAAGAVIGRDDRPDEGFENAVVRRGRVERLYPRDRFRHGRRPEKNPRAFWQVVAGFAYLAGGIVLLEAFVG